MDDEDIVARVGTFFILIASVLIIMFVTSDIAASEMQRIAELNILMKGMHKEPIRHTIEFDLFFIGVLLGGLGIFMRRTAPSPAPSGRFETWKKMRSGEYKDEQAQKRAQRQEENAAKRQARQEEREAKRAAKKNKDNQ